jgi:hypothetical protein
MEQRATPIPFLITWNEIMTIGAIAMVVMALVVYLIYKAKVSAIKELKDKYDYINLNEIKWYRWVFIFVGLSVACLINLYGQDKFFDLGVWFFVRFFFSIAGATLIAYVASLILQFYYPTILNVKLRRLRYTPRINPKTGKKMRLLSEDEEDVHLNEGMQAEENIFSIDYDVWIDETNSDVRIEKYNGHLIALQCNNCGFYTMRVQREEIVERNEDGSPKELLKHYQCSYCKNVRATQFIVSRKEEDDYKLQKPKVKRNTRNIELVKIDVHSSMGVKKSFEFNSIEELEKFLKEFDFDKAS